MESEGCGHQILVMAPGLAKADGLAVPLCPRGSGGHWELSPLHPALPLFSLSECFMAVGLLSSLLEVP